MIPASRVLINWTWAPGTRQIGRVEVTEIPPGEQVVMPDPGQKPSFVPERSRTQSPNFSDGACNPRWMQGDPAHTPAAVFGDMLLTEGFADWDYIRYALVAFTRIEGCEWAREMLGAFHPDIHDATTDDAENK